MLSALTVQPNRGFYAATLLCGESNCGDTHFACRRSSAFPLCVHVPRELGAVAGWAEFVPDDSRDGHIHSVPLTWKTLDGDCDVWSAVCDTDHMTCGLYFFDICFDTAHGTLSLCRSAEGECTLSRKKATNAVPLQLLLYEKREATPEWLYGGVIYQIFVDRFCRAGNTPVSDGGILNPDWQGGMPEYPPYPGAPLKNNVFFGGNIQGIISRLPYLKGLGVCALYLSPVFRSPSNHKYDTGDYETIDPGFGTDSDFKELICKAKEQGMRVILDGVFNHTGDDSKYFNRYGNYDTTGAYQSLTSVYHDWYCFTHFPDQYKCWWDIPILPKLNLSNLSCREYLFGKGGIVDKWSRYGLGGFRLDVADELDDELICEIKQRMTDAVQDSVLYGEVWEDASNKIAYSKRKHYFEGGALDGVMNYPLRTGILSYIKHGNTDALKYAIHTVMAHCPPDTVHTQMNFLGTHDTERALTALGDLDFAFKTNCEISKMKMTAKQRSVACDRLISAYAATATLPGVATVFYGDEAGLEGYKDPFNRMPFPYGRECRTLVHAYEKIGRLRREHRVYKKGGFRLIRLDSDCFAFLREDDSECLLTVINRSSRPMVLESEGGMYELYPKKSRASRLQVAPESAAVCSMTADFRLYGV